MLNREYYSQSELRQLGFTPALITALLGGPDKVFPSPYNRQQQLKFFRREYVEAVMTLPEFAAACKQSAKHRAAGRTSANTRRKKTLHISEEGFQLNLDRSLPEEVLIQAACTHYNQFWADDISEGNKMPARPNASRPFLVRLVVNYLRHECSNYEKLLDDLSGSIGKAEAHQRLRELVLIKMTEAGLGDLAQEYRQMQTEAWA